MAKIGTYPSSGGDDAAPLPISVAAGGQVDLGTTTDAEATGNGTVIGILKRLRTLLAGGLPAALGSLLGLKVEQVYGTVVVGAGVSAAAPAAATVVADTGPLAAGVYRIEASASGSGALAAGVHMEFQHRNAANGANVAAGPLCALGGAINVQIPRIVVAVNERFRFITVGTPAASSVYAARIDAVPTS